MTEPVTLTATVIANLAFQEFLKSSTGEVAKKFTANAISKMSELRQKIWDRLRGKHESAEQALNQAEKGDQKAIETVATLLGVEMLDEIFAGELQLLAQEINAGKLIDKSSMNQNVHDQGTGIQAKSEGDSTQYVAKEMHFHGNGQH